MVAKRDYPEKGGDELEDGDDNGHDSPSEGTEHREEGDQGLFVHVCGCEKEIGKPQIMTEMVKGKQMNRMGEKNKYIIQRQCPID